MYRYARFLIARAVWLAAIPISGIPGPPSLPAQEIDSVSRSDLIGSPPVSACSRHYTLAETIKGSICGVPGDDRPWTPLYLSNFFEGWDEPRIGPPRGSSGVARQGWLNTLDGFFPRSFNQFYSFTDHLNGGGDLHLGQLQLVTPLSRRLFIEVDGPTVVGLDGETVSSRTDLGDVFLIPRVMLHETQNLSISAGMGIQIPTGDPNIGGGAASLFPLITLWSDVGGGWSIRDGAGMDIRTNSGPGPDSSVFTNLALGQILSPHEAAPLGDFAYYVSLNTRTDLGGLDHHTFVSLTPGMRTHLGHNFFFLFGYEVPMAGPRPFAQRFLFQLVKDF